MKTIKVSYIDFWAECGNIPVKFDDINNIDHWKNLKTNRNLNRIDSGVGLFHKEHLEKLLDKNIILSSPENADVIICSGFGNQRYNYPNKKKIFLSFESGFKVLDSNLPNTLYFSANLPLKEGLFYLPLFTCYYGFKIYDVIKEPRLKLTEQEFNNKIDCFSLVSNQSCQYRNDFLKKLTDSIQVHNYGKVLKNIDNEIIQSSCWYDPRLGDYIRKYKFIFCFENTSKVGYHTEKIMHGFRNKVIPIYWGDPVAKLIFNSDAYINVNELGIDKALEKVKLLSKDLNEYNKMLEQPIIKDTSIYNREDIGKFTNENYFIDTIKKYFN